MAKTRKLIVDVIADASKFTSELQKADGYSKRLRGSMQKLGKSMAIGLGVAGGAAIAFGKSALDAAQEAEQVQNRVAAIIKATGGAANVSAKQIEKFAQKQQMLVGVDDEVLKKSYGILLTFKNVRNEAGKGNDIFNRTAKSLADLAAAGFGDTDSAAKAMGKALQDPIKGVTALSRAGVTFSEDQKKMIRTLVESGDLLTAQKIILGEVEGQVGGTAKAGVTASERMKIAFGELQEQVGTALLPAFTKLSDWMIETGLPAVQKFFKWMGDNKTTVTAVAIAFGVLTAAVYAANAAMWALSLNPIVLIIAAIVAGLTLLVAGFIIAYNKSETFKGAVDSLKGRLMSIPPVINAVWDGIKIAFNIWAAGWEIMVNSFIIGLNGIIRGVNFIKPGKDFPTLPHLKIPRLAEGGIVDRPTLAMIGEAGPEAVVPLSRTNGIGTNVTINVTVSPMSSPTDVGAAVVDALQAWSRRNGRLPSSLVA